jgi:hypothetical protein
MKDMVAHLNDAKVIVSIELRETIQLTAFWKPSMESQRGRHEAILLQ